MLLWSASTETPGSGATSAGYSTFADFIKLPNRTDVFSAILAPREPRDPIVNPITFTNHSGNCWKATYPINSNESWYVWDVFQNGAALTPTSSIANCIATVGTWFFALETERVIYVHCGEGEDPNAELMQIAPVFAFATDKPAGSEFAPIFDLSVIKSISAPYQLFECRLSANGLDRVNQELESPYFGVTVPTLSRIEIINGKTHWNDTNGRMDTFQDRFQWRDTPAILYGGDGGTVLDLNEHLSLDTYRVMKTDITDERFIIEFDSSASVLSKKIPFDYFEDEEGNIISYKPIFYSGNMEAMPAIRISPRIYYWAGHSSDFFEGTQIDDVTVPSSDYTVSVSQSKLTFVNEVAEGATVTVVARRTVDINGNPGGIEQYPGSMIRHFLNVYAGIPLSELPAASFVTLDASSIPVQRHISGESQTTIREELDYWLHSLCAWLRHANGVWEVFRYSTETLRGSSATIHEDEILSISKFTERKTIYKRVKVSYSVSNVFDDLWKSATINHPTAGHLFMDAEVLELQPTILKRLVDAEETADRFIYISGKDENVVAIEATGSIFNAYPGDVVTLNKSKGFDLSGEWVDELFIVRSIEKKCTARPGTVSAILVEPATGADLTPSASQVSFGNITKKVYQDVANTSADPLSHQAHASTTKELVAVFHVPDSGSPTTQCTAVTYGGVAMTQIEVVDLPTTYSIKAALWRLDSPAVDSAKGIVATFGATVKSAHVVAIDVLGCTVDSGEDFAVISVPGRDVNKACVADSTAQILAISAVIGRSDDRDLEPAGSISRFTSAAPYGGSQESAFASTAYGWTKSGAASVNMKLTEHENTNDKCIVVVALKP